LEKFALSIVPSTPARNVGFAMAEDATTVPEEAVRNVSTADIATLAKAFKERTEPKGPPPGRAMLV
jgi:hypothetical protein